jgi:hypothetical protein
VVTDYQLVLRATPLAPEDPHAQGVRIYRVVLESGGRNIQTLYWAGSFEGTRTLARQLASKRGAELFRIFEFSTDVEICVEKCPDG